MHLYAQQTLRTDSSKIEIRNLDASRIESYKKQKDFIYTETVASPSLWERFWAWVWDKFDELTSTPGGKNAFNITLITLCVIVLIFFILKLKDMNKISAFSRNKNYAKDYTVESENIHDINFDQQIKDALEQRNYRLAVRLRYLNSLKILSDKELINWQPNKTNYDYFYDIRTPEVKQNFMQLTGLFEHAWYGNATTGEQVFDQIESSFSDLKNSIRQ